MEDEFWYEGIRIEVEEVASNAASRGGGVTVCQQVGEKWKPSYFLTNPFAHVRMI